MTESQIRFLKILILTAFAFHLSIDGYGQDSNPSLSETEEIPKTHKEKGWVLDVNVLSIQPGIEFGYRKSRWEYGLSAKVERAMISDYILISPFLSYFLGMSENKSRPYFEVFMGPGIVLNTMPSPTEVGSSLYAGGANLGLLLPGSRRLRIFFEVGIGLGRSMRKELLNDPLGTRIKTIDYENIVTTTLLGIQF